MRLRILFGLLLLVCAPFRLHADCAALLTDLEELEINSMRKAAFEIRKVLNQPGLSKLMPILNFVGSRFHDEALDSIPLAVPALLMRPDVTREQVEKVMNWIRHAEHTYLQIARDDIIEASKGERFFKVLMNINKLREPIALFNQLQFLEDIEAAELRVGDESIQEWLGIRYRHLNQVLLGVEIPRDQAWAAIKRDLSNAMKPKTLLFVRYFLAMAFLNIEMLEDEKLWVFSAFAKLPENGKPPVLGEEDPTPTIFENDSIQRYWEILSERYPDDDDEDDEPWASSVPSFQAESGGTESDPRDSYDGNQALMLHTLVQSLAFDGSSEEEGEEAEADDVDVSNEFQDVLNDWQLAGVTLNAPTMIEEDPDAAPEGTPLMLTPLQAAYYWDRMPQKTAILKAIEDRELPFWMLPPWEASSPP